MTLMQSVVLGALQGLTEFLPVSSSGHLVIFSSLLKTVNTLSFDIVVHFGSLMAILIFFKEDVRQLLQELSRRKFMDTLIFKIIIGSIPAAAVAIFFKDAIEKAFVNTNLAASMLYMTAILLLTAEFRLKKKAGQKKHPGITDALIIGFFQALAILPGVSRSGSTIAGGIFVGLEREEAARFSFLLVIPAITGSLVLEAAETSIKPIFTLTYLTGFLSSLVFSLLALKILFATLKRYSLVPFAVYCTLLATLYFIFK